MDNLLQILQNTPNISINVRGDDLITFGRDLITLTQRQYQDEKKVEPSSDLLEYKEALALFGVSGQTLWRWRKRGYITPIHVGGKLKYRRSDCEAIINGERR